MKKLTVDIIEDLVNDLDFTQVVTSFNLIGTDKTQLFVDRTFHARKGLTYTVDSVDYTIDSFVYGESVTVNGVVPSPVGKDAVLQKPFFFHETPMKLNNKLSLIKDPSKKLPFIYLVEVLRERKIKTVDSNIDRVSSLRIIFLDNSNKTDWLTDDYYTYVIQGQNDLLEFFIEKIEQEVGLFGEFDEYGQINHPDFGVYINDKGHKRKLFNDNLSGCELSLDLPILKSLCFSE